MFNKWRIQLVTWWRHGRFRNSNVRKKAFEDPYTTTAADGTLAEIVAKRKKLLDEQLQKPEPKFSSIDESLLEDEKKPDLPQPYIKPVKQGSFISDMMKTMRLDLLWVGSKPGAVKTLVIENRRNREKYERFERMARGER